MKVNVTRSQDHPCASSKEALESGELPDMLDMCDTHMPCWLIMQGTTKTVGWAQILCAQMDL